MVKGYKNMGETAQGHVRWGVGRGVMKDPEVKSRTIRGAGE